MTFIKSKLFERDFRFLREFLPSLKHAYNHCHGINFQSLPPQKYPDEAQKAKVARNILEQYLLPATLVEADMLAEIPKKLWLYWNSPLESAPDVVQVSVKSWKAKNPDYEVILLNDENLEAFLGFDFNALFHISTVNLGFAMKADILRLYLLSVHGGVWADTTTFSIRSLSEWLPECSSQTGFFTFRHLKNKTRPVEAWFIAAQKGHFVVRKVLALFLEHLFKERKHCLYVSNNMKSLGLSNDSDERFFLDVVLKAEENYFMPYFSVGYFFNEALRDEKAGDTCRILNNMPNHHAINLDELSVVKSSYVSKQTYKKDYQDSALYHERRAFVVSTLE